VRFDGAFLRKVFEGTPSTIGRSVLDKSENNMRVTVTVDDELLIKARALTGLKETSTVVRQALEALIERDAARRLARLGGTEPRIRHVSRRRQRQ
jgi:Arc/MetJ family transcription regulator